MASTSFGKKACELVREIAESEAGTLPPYNQDLMRTIADQCADHGEAMQTLAVQINEVNDAEDDGALDSDLAVICSFAGALGLEVLLPRLLLDRAPSRP